MRVRIIVPLLALVISTFYFQKQKIRFSSQNAINGKNPIGSKSTDGPVFQINSSPSKITPKLTRPIGQEPHFSASKIELALDELVSPNEKYAHFPEEKIVQEYVRVKELWFRTRAQAYLHLGLAESEARSLENLRLVDRLKFDELAQYWGQASDPGQYAEFQVQIRAQENDFDEEVRKLLGDEGFRFLLAVRSQFNADLDETDLRPRIGSNW